MKSDQWKTYRTRFLVQAKQLQSSLTFVDHLGRQHCGRKGDYLVESSDGVLSIAPRRIFEDIYVPMTVAANGVAETTRGSATSSATPSGSNFEPIRIQEVTLPQETKLPDSKFQDLRIAPGKVPDFKIKPRSSAVRERKQPQPVRDRHPSPSHLSLM